MHSAASQIVILHTVSSFNTIISGNRTIELIFELCTLLRETKATFCRCYALHYERINLAGCIFLQIPS